MKTILPCLAILLAAFSPLAGQTNTQLEKALFAEEVEQNPIKAAAIYQKMVDLSAKQPRNLAFARFRLAKLHQAADRQSEALAELEALIDTPGAPAEWIAQADKLIAIIEPPASKAAPQSSSAIYARLKGKLWDWHAGQDLQGDSYGTLRFLPDGTVETTRAIEWVTRWSPVSENRFRIYQIEGKYWTHELSADGTETTALSGNGVEDAAKRLSLHPVQGISIDEAEIAYLKQMLVNQPDAIAAYRIPGSLAQQNRIRALAFLFDHGIPVDVRENASWRFTPLMFAVESGNEETVEFLLGRGADVKLLDNRNVAPLFVASSQGDAAIVSQLIEADADLDSDSGYLYEDDKRHDFGTALHGAAYQGHTAVVRLLVDRGADINALSSAESQTALTQALVRTDFLMAKELLSLGADPNVPANGVSNPLREMAIQGNLAMTRLLLEHGAKHDIQSAETFEYSGVTRTVGGALAAAARMGQLGVAKALVEAGAPVDQMSPGYQETPLHAAALYGNTTMCRWLLKEGTDRLHGLAKEAGLQSGWTPLHSAACRQSLDVVNLLMENGMSPGTPAGDLGLRRTPFQVAVLKGFVPVVKRMLAQASDRRVHLLAQQDTNGDTALHLAVSREAKASAELVRLLIEVGAPVDIVNQRNQTPRQRCLAPEIGIPDERIRALLGE